MSIASSFAAAATVPCADPDLREFAETAAAFARSRLAEAVAMAEETDEPPADLLTRPADQGLWTLGAAEEHGGGGADLLALALAVGGVAAGAPAVAAAMAGVHAALHAVSDAAVASLVSGATDASLPILIDTRSPAATLRITPSAGNGHAEDGPPTDCARAEGEPLAGGTRVEDELPAGDVRAEGEPFAGNGRTEDEPLAGGARVEGSVARVEGAAQAGAFVVLDDTAGAVIVDAREATIGPPLRRTGLRGWPPCPVTFTGATGPLHPAAGDYARQTLAVLLAAAASGVAFTAATAAEEYIAIRHQFGAPIADLPAVATLAADATADARECAKAAMTDARFRAEPGTPPDPTAARSAAVRRARTAVSVAERAIQLHGGYGYLTEYPVEHALRDAVTLRALITAIP